MDKHLVSGEVLLTSICLLVLCAVLILLLVVKLVAERKRNGNLLSQKKAMAGCLIPILEMERQNIARDVHDDIGSILGILKINLSKVLTNLREGKESKDLVENSIHLSEEAIKSTRAISHALMPSSLTQLGFESTIVELCRQMNACGQFNVSISIEAEQLKFNAEIELQLFRVVQEVLNNIIKHESPSGISICLRNSADHALEIEIKHNGPGITHEKIKELAKIGKGVGLKSVFTRMEMLRGSICYSANNDNNSGVKISLPLRYDEINQAGYNR
ncbi:MAG TPA: ATP-binding protein [Bacteroidia bacterium]|jgi:signal transduction histidine kinase